jgi:hypothetical protein
MSGDGESADSYNYDDDDFDVLEGVTPGGNSEDADTYSDSESKDSNGEDEGSKPTAEPGIADTPDQTQPESSDGMEVSAEEVGQNPKKPPGGKTTLHDIIHQRSWPGRQRFERDEAPIIRTHPYWWVALKSYASGVICILAGIIGGYTYFDGSLQKYVNSLVPIVEIDIGSWFLYMCLILILTGLAIIAIAFIRRLHTWYIVTDQRTWVREGVMSRRDRGSLDHHKVNNVEEVNPFPLNLWGVGHVRLFTAASDGAEITIERVKNPSKLAQTIRSEMQSHARGTPPEEMHEDE